MRNCIPWLMLALCAAILRADDPPKPKPDDANKPVEVHASEKAALEAAIGKDVVVTGTIKKAQWSNTGKVMNIDFENSPLLAAVFERNRDAINQAFDGDAAKKWTGAKVKISGKLEKYGGRSKTLEGRPQIIISKADQVKIEEPRKE